jgi:uridine phosphorylase
VAERPIHIHPTAELADRALLPGDPGRALVLAQHLLTDPLMFNHHRGLWGYTGQAADGRPLTIQATGMGGPSAAIVLEELADLGLRLAVRVGTCGALVDGFAHGDLLVVDAALPADGTSRALGAAGPVAADAGVTAALAAAAGERGRTGTAVTSDLFYDPDPERPRTWVAEGALAVEMEAATVLRVAERRGIRAGCLLAVTDLLAGPAGRERITDDELAAAGTSLGDAAAAGLAALD